jgi:hypothetical protein
MKQTAVQLLRQRLLNDQQNFPIYNEYINGILYDIDNEFLKMEKQQIIESIDETNSKWRSQKAEIILTGNHYYNLKFKNK